MEIELHSKTSPTSLFQSWHSHVYAYWSGQKKNFVSSFLHFFHQAAKADPDEHTITTVENPAAIVTAVEEPVPQPEKVIMAVRELFVYCIISHLI